MNSSDYNGFNNKLSNSNTHYDKFGVAATETTISSISTPYTSFSSGFNWGGIGKKNIWNRGFEINDGGDFAIPVTSGNHASVFNCDFYDTRVAGVGAAVEIGFDFNDSPWNPGTTVAQSSGTDGVALANQTAVNYSFNAYGSLFTAKYNVGVILDDAFNCIFRSPNNDTSFSLSVYLKGGARIISNLFQTGSRDTVGGEVQLRGAFRSFEDNTMTNVFITPTATLYSHTLLVNPVWTNTDQSFFFNLNGNLSLLFANNGIMTIGAFIWNIPTTATVTGVTDGFTGKILFGGVGYRAAGASIIQHYGYNPTFASSPVGDNFVNGIRVYAKTNAGVSQFDATRLNISSKINTTADSEKNTVCEYISNSSGKLISNRYSTDKGANWSDGFINWARFNTSTSVGANVLGQVWGTSDSSFQASFPQHTIATPIQIAKSRALTEAENSSGNAMGVTFDVQHTLVSELDIRSYNYGAGANANDIDVQVGSIPIFTDRVVFIKNANVKDSNVVSGSPESKSALLSNTAFSNSVSGTDISPNDIHDLSRWLWSNYEIPDPNGVPTVTNGLAMLYKTSTDKMNITLVNTGGQWFNGNSALNIRTRATSKLTPSTTDAVTGLGGGILTLLSGMKVVNTNLAFDTIKGIAPNTTQDVDLTEANSHYTDVVFGDSEATTVVIEVPMPATGDRYINFKDCSVSADATSVTINTTGTSTGTLYVTGMNDSNSKINHGKDVENAPQPAEQETAVRVNIANLPVGAEIQLRTDEVASAPVFAANKDSLTDTELIFSSGAISGKTIDHTIAGLGDTETILNLTVASKTFATTSWSFTVPNNSALGNADQVYYDFTPNGASDQSSSIDSSAEIGSRAFVVRATDVGTSDTLFDDVTKSNQTVIEVNNCDGDDWASAEMVNRLASECRESQNYATSMRKKMGTITASLLFQVVQEFHLMYSTLQVEH